VGGQRLAPAALPPRKSRNPLYRWLGGHQCQSGQVWKTSQPPGFDYRTFQPVTSRYNDRAITAHFMRDLCINILYYVLSDKVNNLDGLGKILT
jgi:hypothetical protein